MKTEDNRIVKTYKYPMYPNVEQERVLLSWMEKGKWIYNLALQEYERLYHLKKNDEIAYLEAQKNGIRKKGEKAGTFSQDTAIYNKVKEYILKYPDLRELPAVCVDKILEQVKQAYGDFFKNIKTKKAGGYDKPQDKLAKDDFSLKCKDGGFDIEVVGNRSARVYGFPKIANGLKIRYYRKIDGEVRTQTIIREGDYWYLCVSIKKDRPLPLPNKKQAVGVDLGIVRTVQLSDGSFDNLPKEAIDGLLARKKVLQRRLRKKKGGNRNKREKQSNNYKKAYKKIAKIDEKIVNIKKYWQKRIATEIARSNEVVIVEKLKVKNMTKSAKGTVDKPGENVKAKSGLNRSILMTAPYFFKNFLQQKCNEYSSICVEVNPAYTSQTCSKCGFIDRESRIDQSRFRCVECNFELNADHNAAINILNKGILK